MRDYTELIKQTRESLSEVADCMGCCVGWSIRENKCLLDHCADAIEELLAAAPETAFWVDTQPHLDDSSYKKDGMAYYCSNCHHRAGKYKHRSYKFCPWCGARIVPKDAAIADMLPPLQNGEDKADLIEQMERFQEYAKGGSK